MRQQKQLGVVKHTPNNCTEKCPPRGERLSEKKEKTPTSVMSYLPCLGLLFTCLCSSSPLGGRGGGRQQGMEEHGGREGGVFEI